MSAKSSESTHLKTIVVLFVIKSVSQMKTDTVSAMAHIWQPKYDNLQLFHILLIGPSEVRALPVGRCRRAALQT